MNIDFKNILAGVGGVGVLVTVAILGMFSSASDNLFYKPDLISVGQNEVLDFCPSDSYEFAYEYPFPRPIGTYGSKSAIVIGPKGKIINLIVGNRDIHAFNKDTGGDFSMFIDSYPVQKYFEQSFYIPGIYIDESNNRLYASGQGNLSFVYIYKYDPSQNNFTGDKIGEWSFLSDGGAKSIGGHSGDVYILPVSAANNKFSLKVFSNNLTKTLKKEVSMPYRNSDFFEDMAVDNAGNAYILMNARNVAIKDSVNQIIGYENQSIILRYDKDLNLLTKLESITPFRFDPTDPFAQIKRKVEKDQNGNFVPFTKAEIEDFPFFSRIEFGKDGKFVVLMKNKEDGNRTNLFRKYDEKGNITDEWIDPGKNFNDIAIDDKGTVFASSDNKIHKYTKDECGKLYITKITEPRGLNQEFNFNIIDPKTGGILDNNSGKYTFSLKHGETKEYTMPDGSYNLIEKEIVGFDTKIFCSNGDNPRLFNPFVSPYDTSTINDWLSREVHITTGRNSNTYCTFTNIKKSGNLEDSPESSIDSFKEE